MSWGSDPRRGVGISKAKKKLGWKPKVKFKELVKMMVDVDIKCIKGSTNK